MRKGIDTHVLASRQLVLWAAAGGDIEQAVRRALPLPRYVIHRADSVEAARAILGRSKVEVALVEAVGVEVVAAAEALQNVDPDLEILLVGPRALVDELSGRAPQPVFDLLGAPFSDGELRCRAELARERRYLRRSETRGKRVEARMGAIMRALPTGIVSVDEDGVVHDWNPACAHIFGHSDLEALGQNLWALLGIDPAALRGPDGAALSGRKLELTARHRRGHAFPIELSLVPLPLSERTMSCAIIEDRTEAKRLEADLRQAQKLEAVGQLAAGLAHEINTPCQFIGDSADYIASVLKELGPISGAYRDLRAAASADAAPPAVLAKVDEIEAQADLDFAIEQGPRSVQTIREGVARISEIVKAMSSFARTDWSAHARVDVGELLGSILLAVAHEAASLAEVEATLTPVPPIIAHGGDLNQALFNLVRNALDALAARLASGRGRGKLTVTCRGDGEGVQISIADTGPGIAPAIRERVFEPFFTTKEVGRGSGQGLSLAWSVIVETLGGRLSFDSVEGEGTTFHVHLPARHAKTS